jgi:hypothetical protein
MHDRGCCLRLFQGRQIADAAAGTPSVLILKQHRVCPTVNVAVRLVHSLFQRSDCHSGGGVGQRRATSDRCCLALASFGSGKTYQANGLLSTNWWQAAPF